MKKFIIFLLISNAFILRAQEDYRSGFLITNKFDTIRGLIDYNSNKNYSIKFKLNNSDNITEYKPFEIYGFRFINDKYYISTVVTIQKSYIRKEQITYNINDPMAPRYIEKAWYDDYGHKNDSVFLEFLIDGKIKIFYYKDVTGLDHYFAKKDNDSLLDLTQDVINIYENGVLFSNAKSESYKGKLLSIMQDCPQLQNEINRTKLDHKSLIKLSKEYHNYVCKDNNCIVYERAVKPIQYKAIIDIGTGYSETSKFDFHDGTSPNFIDKNYLLFGLSLHINNYLPNLEKTSFILGFDLFKNSYLHKFTTKSFNFNGGDTVVNLIYNSSNICFYEKIIQKISTKPQGFYLSAGLSELYSFNELVKNQYETPLDKFSIDNSGNHLQVGLNFALGYDIPVFNNSNHILVEVQYIQFIFKQFNTIFTLGYEF